MNTPLNTDQRMLKLLQAPPDQIEAIDRILNGEPPPKSRILNAPALLGTSAAARALGVSRGTLWRMVQGGTLKRVEIFRGSFRIRRSEIEDLLDGVTPTPPTASCNATALAVVARR